MFEQSSVEKAQQLETRINEFHANLLSILKDSEPEAAEALESFKVLTNVIETRLNVFITTTND